MLAEHTGEELAEFKLIVCKNSSLRLSLLILFVCSFFFQIEAQMSQKPLILKK
jgi:hypothetical protein